MKNLKVSEKYNNKKISAFLLDTFPGLTMSTFQKALRKKDIRINDKRISENCLIKTGDDIKIYIVDDLLEKKMDIPIIYEDENIVIFNKPIGIEVTGDNSVYTYAKKIYKQNSNSFIEPCHRLDMNTSGLVLFARNQESLNILLNAFKNHKIEKHYICVVYGIPQKKENRLISYLFKDSKKSTVYISDIPKPGYQKIITSYKLINKSTSKNLSLLDITLETGKTHQIRAHLAHIKLPIIGDGKYGINSINKDFKQKYQLLSSYSLTFNIEEKNKLSYLNKKNIKQKTLPFQDFFKL